MWQISSAQQVARRSQSSARIAPCTFPSFSGVSLPQMLQVELHTRGHATVSRDLRPEWQRPSNSSSPLGQRLGERVLVHRAKQPESST